MMPKVGRRVRRIMVADCIYICVGEGFIVSVTHIPSHSNETKLPMDSNKNAYRRMIAFENSDRRVEITGNCFFITSPPSRKLSTSSRSKALHSGGKRDLYRYALPFDFCSYDLNSSFLQDENALQAMSHLAKHLLSQSDLGM
jgi:hypothetical protein